MKDLYVPSFSWVYTVDKENKNLEGFIPKLHFTHIKNEARSLQYWLTFFFHINWNWLKEVKTENQNSIMPMFSDLRCWNIFLWSWTWISSYHTECVLTNFLRVMVLETGLTIADKNIQWLLYSGFELPEIIVLTNALPSYLKISHLSYRAHHNNVEVINSKMKHHWNP